MYASVTVPSNKYWLHLIQNENCCSVVDFLCRPNKKPMKKKPHKNYYYTIYGLHLRANRPLPEVQPALPPDTESNLVRVFMVGEPNNLPVQPQTSQSPYYTSPIQEELDTPILQVWRDQLYYHLVYHYGNQFLINRAGDTVWCSWPAKSDFGLVIAYLLGPVLGFMLRLRGVLVLHASAVALNGQALAIVGARGAGKSTLAAELCRHGCQALSDDIAALTWSADQRVLVQPGYPRLRLWPESADALYGPEHNLRPMVPGMIHNGANAQYFDKRYLELDDGKARFLSTPQPLRAIYILDWRKKNDEVQITSSYGASALVMLDAQSYLTYLLDQHDHTQQLAALAQILKSTPVRKLHSINDLAALPVLAATILKNFEKLIRQ